MAFRDQNGKITIDEVAAQQDIQKLATAINALETARRSITHLIQQAENEQGETSIAVVEKATELKTEIEETISRLSETSDLIKKTVAQYQLIDQQIRDAINSSQITASSTPPVDLGQLIKDGLKKFGGGE